MYMTIYLDKIMSYEPCIKGYMKLLNNRMKHIGSGGTFNYDLTNVSIRYVLKSNGLTDTMWLIRRMIEDKDIKKEVKEALKKILIVKLKSNHNATEVIKHIKKHFDYTEAEDYGLMQSKKTPKLKKKDDKAYIDIVSPDSMFLMNVYCALSRAYL